MFFFVFCGQPHSRYFVKELFICFRFGFVDFDSVDDAKQALESMKGENIDGRQVALDFAESREGGENRNLLPCG